MKPISSAITTRPKQQHPQTGTLAGGHGLATLESSHRVAAWLAAFDEIWQRLPTTTQPPAQRVAVNDWREAIAAAGQPGRGGKILLDFTVG